MSEIMFENELLEASFVMLSTNYQELEAETTLFVQKITNSCKCENLNEQAYPQRLFSITDNFLSNDASTRIEFQSFLRIRQVKVLDRRTDMNASADALKAIAKDICNNGQIALLKYIKDLCNRDWIVSFAQTARNNNGVADRLSKMASEVDFRVERFDEPPMEVLSMLNFDIPS
ncbi:hypothetical protein V6N11_055375 [Hibiscus sabdariffa]|uniref:RNase H type-1 domain-containing protein n=2 Tax=Hibiscus sabdariffa TaxID=183260 RepID=A0ABR2PF52_9ROSI